MISELSAPGVRFTISNASGCIAYDDEVNPLFVEALMNYEYVDNIIEQLISGNQDEKDKIICDVETDVVKFEEILKQYIVLNTDVEISI